jgi:anti-repressor protein
VLAPVDHEGRQLIDARALHGWLGQRQRFNDWMRERLAAYGFEDGTDFYCRSSKTGGRPRRDYLLTVDMAKELSMVERTERGRVKRRSRGDNADACALSRLGNVVGPGDLRTGIAD